MPKHSDNEPLAWLKTRSLVALFHVNTVNCKLCDVVLDLYHVLLFYVRLSANFVADHQNVPIVLTMVHGPLQMNQHIGQWIDFYITEWTNRD